MRLRVQHEDGSIETLTLREPLVLAEGQHQNRITDASGKLGKTLEARATTMGSRKEGK